jgi:hypothetical protein
VAIVISRKNEKSVKVLEKAFPKLIKKEQWREKLWKREVVAFESLERCIGNM